VGIAPFLHLSKKLGGGKLLFGAKNSALIPDLTEFRKYCEVVTATEDGSEGRKGTVIDLLAAEDLNEYTIYACGPHPMFRAIKKVLKNCGDAEAYFSIETVMGCGFGACKGCAVETNDGSLKLACTEGPVFPWKEIEL
jgi:dihydroorotate dehydrogenase electron transfer subunit